MESGYIPPEDPGKFDTDPGNNGGGDNAPYGGMGGGCKEGLRETQIGADGNWLPYDKLECVDEATYQARLAMGHQTNGGDSGGGGGAGGPSAPKGPASLPKVPQFDPGAPFAPPQFKWDEIFKAPSLEEAQNEPGYAFARDEGLGALQHSQAASGLLRSGGSLKDLIGWGNKFAEQNYGNVFDRYSRGYDTRLKTAEDKFGFDYRGAKDVYDTGYQAKKDVYAPNLLGWQANANAAQSAWEKAWQDYWRNTLSASDYANLGNPNG